MIYLGDNEIQGIYLGNDEIAAIYAGTEQIYPMNFGTLTGISLENLTWVTDVPASGGTADSGNCSFNVYAKFDSGKRRNITSKAVISGSMVVSASTADTRINVGTLTLTATYSGFTDSATVDAYQDVDFRLKPLTFEIISAGTVVFKANNSSAYNTISYSINGGTWNNITASSAGASISVSVGDIVEFKGNNSRYGVGDGQGCRFSGGTAAYNVYGNIMSLIQSEGFETATTLTQNYAFCAFFMGSKIVSLENLVLPATTLTTWCYKSMFHTDSTITKAPKELPATVMQNSCYRQMFLGTSITKAPKMTITTAADYCCGGMFEEVTTLTDVSEITLSAQTLTPYCYHYMFRMCTSLTTAPVLPATTLANRCYENMFVNCSNLTHIKCLATTNINTTNCSNWVNGVAASGTFEKAASASWGTGTSAVPSGWTVINAT